MLALVAIVPSAPLLVPELAGPAAADTEPVREAVLAAGRRLAAAAPTWIAVGAADDSTARGRGADPREYARTGDFGAYGVPVPVRLAGPASPAEHPPVEGAPLPLSMLIAGWLGGRSRHEGRPVSVSPRVIGPSTTPEECARLGHVLAADLAADPDPVGLLVVADGATALTPAAPGGGERPEAVALQRRIDAAVTAADTGALAGLTAARCAEQGAAGRAAWQVLAGVGDHRRFEPELLYRGAPFGVGYTVATWTPVPTGAGR